LQVRRESKEHYDLIRLFHSTTIDLAMMRREEIIRTYEVSSHVRDELYIIRLYKGGPTVSILFNESGWAHMITYEVWFATLTPYTNAIDFIDTMAFVYDQMFDTTAINVDDTALLWCAYMEAFIDSVAFTWDDISDNRIRVKYITTHKP
jgi:hypothetical protein